MRLGAKANGATLRDMGAVRAFRYSRSKKESPRVLFWIGLAILVLTLLNLAIGLLTPRTFALHGLLHPRGGG